MNLGLDGAGVLVTGGSGGIGFELARQFAQNGYDLVICADHAPKLNEAAQALSGLGEGGSGQVHPVAADLADRQGVEILLGEIEALGRPVDVLCANAGVGVQGEFATETSLEDELRMIQLNCASVVHLTKQISRSMVERGQGRILITSSVAGVMPAPYMAVYAATKAFDRFFAEGLRGELKEHGVTVTALEPGPVETNFFDRAGMQDTKAGQGKKSDPADVAKTAYEALMAGKDHVLPGGMAKVMGMTEHLPDTAKAAIHGSMTKSQDDQGRRS